MAFIRGRGHAALRRGRASESGQEYFITVCTANRRTGLTKAPVANAVLAETHRMTADLTWRMRCMVVMPDHIHLVMTLGARLSLGTAIRRLKAKTSGVLSASGLEWEREFYDRLLRANDDRLAVFQYIFLNPYRAGLVTARETWPHYYCCPADWEWFSVLLDADRPMPEWLL